MESLRIHRPMVDQSLDALEKIRGRAGDVEEIIHEIRHFFVVYQIFDVEGLLEKNKRHFDLDKFLREDQRHRLEKEERKIFSKKVEGVPPRGTRGVPPRGTRGVPPRGTRGVPPRGTRGVPPRGTTTCRDYIRG
jgi:hypothetical protein